MGLRVCISLNYLRTGEVTHTKCSAQLPHIRQLLSFWGFYMVMSQFNQVRKPITMKLTGPLQTGVRGCICFWIHIVYFMLYHFKTTLILIWREKTNGYFDLINYTGYFKLFVLKKWNQCLKKLPSQVYISFLTTLQFLDKGIHASSCASIEFTDCEFFIRWQFHGKWYQLIMCSMVSQLSFFSRAKRKDLPQIGNVGKCVPPIK